MRITSGAQLATTGSFINTGVLDLLTSASSLPAGFVNSGVVIENTDRRVISSSKAGANFSVSVIGHTGHSYQLQRSDTLTEPWTNIGSAVAGTGSTIIFTDTGGASGDAGFYRVLITP